MSLTINAPRIEGFGGKSIGTTAVTCDGRKYWLKVSGLIGYSRNRSREGEIEAESLQEIPKPAVVRSCEWIDGNVYWRAVLQSLAPSPAIARMPWLQPSGIRFSDTWLADLRAALAALRNAHTARCCFTGDDIRHLISSHFGPAAPTVAKHWQVSHGDLQWSNITAPKLMLLDWENWGWAPCGYDVARLLAYSALDPQSMRTLQRTFAKELETPSGHVATLTAIAMVFTDIAAGHADPGLAANLKPLAQGILAQY